MTAVDAVISGDVSAGALRGNAGLKVLRSGSAYGQLRNIVDNAQTLFPNGGGYRAMCVFEHAALCERPIRLTGRSTSRNAAFAKRCFDDPAYGADFERGTSLARDALTACRHQKQRGHLWQCYETFSAAESTATLDGFCAQVEHLIDADGSTRW